VVAEGAAAPAPPPLLQIELADGARTAPAGGAAAWTEAGPLDDLDLTGLAVRAVGGADVLFVAAAGGRYAYRPACPACGASLAAATVTGETLACGCGAAFDVRRAGRALDGGDGHLEPVPLLVAGDGTVRVALGAGV
jgi:nitrite reductase/ring-hydroxylating ferredoxin subunit